MQVKQNSVPKRKNILFITSDQQHWSVLGCLNSEVKTPNLDRLARKGMLFERAYTVNPTCTPTRASWITGLYPSQHGAYSLGTKLMEDVPTVGDYFKKSGYRTALIGKAHFQPTRSTPDYPSLESFPKLHDLGFWREFHGPFYGFDHVELTRNHTDEFLVGQHYAIWMQQKGCDKWRDYFLPTPHTRTEQEPDGFPSSKRHSLPEGCGAWDIPEELHYNAWIAERTNALLEGYRRGNDNFFLWASFFDPHPQYMVPEPYASMYDWREVTVPEHLEGEFEDKPPYFKLAREVSPDYGDFREEDGSGIHGACSHLRPHETRAKNIAIMYGMMTMLDKYIGKILDKLEELGLADETLVCFTSDHGDFLGQHGLVEKAIHHYEDLLRVPMMVSLPGVVPQGVRSSALQSSVDIAPSFLSMAGLHIPRHMTGMDQSPVWTGACKSCRSGVIIENQHQPTKLNIRSYVNERYKITFHAGHDYGEIYDLEHDPGELVNLWARADCRELKRALMEEYIQAEMRRASLPMPRISGA